LKEIEQLKRNMAVMREVTDDWKENLAIMEEVSHDDRSVLQSVERLCKSSNRGNMIKIGLTLLAFPFPIVVDDVLGCSFLVAGLVQRKIRNSALYLEDINNSLPNLVKELKDSFVK
jgi:hypothetical protein